MNEIIINDKPLPIREYKGNRVVTLKEIDEVHGRKDGTARKRFNDNKKRFIEGVDYFKITASEFRTLFEGLDMRHQTDISLITESGYLMLVKSFSDDLAWTVQRELVNFYFRGRTPAPKPKQITLETSEYIGYPLLTGRDNRLFQVPLQIFQETNIIIHGNEQINGWRIKGQLQILVYDSPDAIGCNDYRSLIFQPQSPPQFIQFPLEGLRPFRYHSYHRLSFPLLIYFPHPTSFSKTEKGSLRYNSINSFRCFAALTGPMSRGCKISSFLHANHRVSFSASFQNSFAFSVWAITSDVPIPSSKSGLMRSTPQKSPMVKSLLR